MPLPLSFNPSSGSQDRHPTPNQLSPPVVDGLIARSRLLREMDRSSGVIAIVGPPAIGKTALAASWTGFDWAAEHGPEVFWYQINDVDEDIATFFRSMNEAVARRPSLNATVPVYSAEALIRLGGFAVAWLNSLFRIRPRPPIVFIFDDVHRIVPGSPMLVVLTRMARALRDDDRLILISRQDIPAQITDVARRRRRLITITDLGIDEVEFADFEQGLAERGQSLTQTDFLAAVRHSGYWMANLPLLGLMGPPAHIVQEKLGKILAELDDADRAALAATAYLQTGLEEEWTVLGGRPALKALLNIEVATGLVRRRQNDALRKHDTIYAGIIAWAEQEVSPTETANAKMAAAAVLVGRGEVLGGVRLLADAKAFDAVRDTILAHAIVLIDHAKNKELLDIISALPDEHQTVPAIELWKAYAQLPFSPDKAAAQLADLRADFGPRLTVSERALAITGEIYGMLSTMMIDGRMPQLIDAATELLPELIAVQEPMRSRFYIGRLIAVLLGAPTLQDHASIRDEATVLMPDLTRESHFVLAAALVTHLLWWEGKVEIARDYHERLSQHAARADAAHLPVIDWHLGALSLAFRDGDEAQLTRALKKLEIFAGRRGLDDRLGPAYWMASQAYAAMGNGAAAGRALKQYVSHTRTMRDLQEHEEPFLRSVLALSRGDIDTAAEEAAVAWSLADGRGAIQGRGLSAVVLAMSYAFKGDARAFAAIDEVAEIGRRTHNTIFLVHTNLATAALAAAQRRWQEFAPAWQAAVELSLSLGVRSLAGFNADALGRLAFEALTRDIVPVQTSRLIRLWRLLPPANEPILDAWPYHLEIRCLNQNVIEIITCNDNLDRQTVAARSRTFLLLALLAVAGQKGLPQQTLIEELWSGVAIASPSNSLRQQINDVRKLTTTAGVIFDDGCYRLNDELVMTDIGRLDDAIRMLSDEGLEFSERIAACDRALGLYTGPLLPESNAEIVKERRLLLDAKWRAEAAKFLHALARRDPLQTRMRQEQLDNIAAESRVLRARNVSST